MMYAATLWVTRISHEQPATLMHHPQCPDCQPSHTHLNCGTKEHRLFEHHRRRKRTKLLLAIAPITDLARTWSNRDDPNESRLSRRRWAQYHLHLSSWCYLSEVKPYLILCFGQWKWCWIMPWRYFTLVKNAMMRWRTRRMDETHISRVEIAGDTVNQSQRKVHELPPLWSNSSLLNYEIIDRKSVV